ncbi:hypothetical protein CXG81DRAFT_16134, partial [Caulochytrium protostelioides]
MPGCFHKTDREGHPIYLDRMGMVDVKGLATHATTETVMDYHVRNNEFLFNVLMPLCQKRWEAQPERHTVIFDCDGMGFHQFYMPGLMILKSLSEHDAAYYPERMHRLFIVNSPTIFLRAWSIIKRWLDKRMLEKVFILGKDYSQLSRYIAPENLPVAFGGTCTCSHMKGGC